MKLIAWIKSLRHKPAAVPVVRASSAIARPRHQYQVLCDRNLEYRS